MVTDPSVVHVNGLTVKVKANGSAGSFTVTVAVSVQLVVSSVTVMV